MFEPSFVFKLAHQCSIDGCPHANDIGVFDTQQQCVDFVNHNLAPGARCLITHIPFYPNDALRELQMPVSDWEPLQVVARSGEALSAGW